MSALGHKRTFRSFRPMSALPPKADIVGRHGDVRFVPEADVSQSYSTPLSARNKSAFGTFSSIAFAARRLMMNSNLVGCRKVRRRCSPQDLDEQSCQLAIPFRDTRTIGCKPALFDHFRPLIDGRQTQRFRSVNDESSVEVEQWSSQDVESGSPRRFDLAQRGYNCLSGTSQKNR
jgi:hypothetical protein